MRRADIDPRVRIIVRNDEGYRFDCSYQHYHEFMRDVSLLGGMSATNEVLLVVHGEQVIYSSLGKKRKISCKEVYEWFSYTGGCDGDHEEFGEAWPDS